MVSARWQSAVKNAPSPGRQPSSGESQIGGTLTTRFALTHCRSAACRLARLSVMTLAVAIVIWLSGCTTSPPRYDGAVANSRLDVGPLRNRLVDVTLAQVGVPYRYGGDSRSGFDCSGLVQYAHADIGIAVPRTTKEQWRQGRPVSRGQMMPGDLLFFELGWRKARHVGIYIGDGTFVHAPSSGKHVSQASVDGRYWQRHFAGARSFLPTP